MHQKGPVFDLEEWRRHGWMMPACVVGVMLIAVHNYALGVMIRPLEQEFGWSRAEISIGPMIPSLGAIVMAPWVGAAVDRYGPRRVALFGVPFFAGALALLSTATSSIVSWWALYALLGVASMFIFPMVWTSAINARFDRNRGLALAVALAGTGISASILPFLATWLLGLQGWRGAYVTIGLLCFLVAFPLTFFLFDRNGRPAQQAPDSSLKAANRLVVRGQLFSARYLKLLGAALFFSLAACALTSNAVPILLGEDFDPLTAAGIAGTIGLGSIIGRLGGGVLLDRFDGRFVAAGSVVAPAITAMILLATQGSEAAATAACFLLGLAAGAEYDACAYLTARHFGLRNFGALFGLVAGVTLFANGVAPALSNHVYDVTRSYDLVLWALLPLFAIAAMLFVSMGRYPTLEGEPEVFPPLEQAVPA
jgi:MFS family permease